MLDHLPAPLKDEESRSACAHCGSFVAPGLGGRFCCRGCETVYTLLQSNGLGGYYDLKRRLRAAPAKPIRAEGLESFAYLDDPTFVEGYAEAKGARMRFYLEGVHCAACVWLTERLPRLDSSVRNVGLNLSSGVATVEIYPGGSFARVAEEFARLGYRPHPVELREATARESREGRRQLLGIGVAAAGAGNLMLFGIAMYAGAGEGFASLFRGLSLAIYLPVLFYSGRPFFESAVLSIRKRRLAIDVPIAFGILSGTAASIRALVVGSGEIYFDSLAGLIFLLLASRYLLARVQARAADASHLLHFLTPSRARRIDDTGVVREVRSDTLALGDRVEVLAGSVAPADGVIESGQTAMSRSWMTGETDVEAVSEGDYVLAGSLNESARVVLRVTASGSETRLGEILRRTEGAVANRPEISRIVDAVARYFVPATFLLIGVGYFLGSRIGAAEAVSRAIAVAIVVCPCALAMAVPLAMSRTIGRLAKGGVLVRGADVIERLSRVRTVYFDKTGTLTSGELSIREWRSIGSGLEKILLGLESKSQHPIARAIRDYPPFRSTRPAALDDVRELPGVGVSGNFAGKTYSLRGTRTLDLDTEVTLYENETAVGVLLFSDPLRPGAREAVDGLRSRGLEVGILSGDNRPSVERVAREIGISSEMFFSGYSPEQKADRVRSEPNTLMVGDGANDAIALAAASVGMAVQGGMEVSLRAAGIFGASKDPRDVVRLIDLARETMVVIRRCLAFTLAYNGVVIAIALSGAMRPLIAAILMPTSAFTVFALAMTGTAALRRAFREMTP